MAVDIGLDAVIQELDESQQKKAYKADDPVTSPGRTELITFPSPRASPRHPLHIPFNKATFPQPTWTRLAPYARLATKVSVQRANTKIRLPSMISTFSFYFSIFLMYCFGNLLCVQTRNIRLPVPGPRRFPQPSRRLPWRSRPSQRLP